MAFTLDSLLLPFTGDRFCSSRDGWGQQHLSYSCHRVEGRQRRYELLDLPSVSVGRVEEDRWA